MKAVEVFAPATIANFGTGFDMFGAAIDGIGDIVHARRADSRARGVMLTRIENNPGLDIGPNNVVTAVGKYVQEAAGENAGIELVLKKKMKIGTGMGSSASSSVAAALAVNELLEKPFDRDDPVILEAVAYGEKVACGSAHCDNVYPSLLGGYILIDAEGGYRKFEGSDKIWLAVIAPDLRVDTKMAREALNKSPYKIANLVADSMALAANNFYGRKAFSGNRYDLESLAYINKREAEVAGREWIDTAEAHKIIAKYQQGFITVLTGVREHDAMFLGMGMMMDKIITPIRAAFIPGFDNAREAALTAGACGFTISGSGPAMVLVAVSRECAEASARAAMDALPMHSDVYISTINNHGAKVTEVA